MCGFRLFWGMIMTDNEFKTKEIKFKPGIKLLNHNIYIEIHKDGANDCEDVLVTEIKFLSTVWMGL